MTTTTFKIDRMDAAVFIMATGAMKLIGLEDVRPGTVAFVFDGDQDQGEQYVYNFDNGGTAVASRLLASMRFLRQQITRHINRNIRGSQDARINPETNFNR